MDLDENQEKFWCKLCKYSIFAVTFHEHIKSHLDPKQKFFDDVYVDETTDLITAKKYSNSQWSTFIRPKNMQNLIAQEFIYNYGPKELSRWRKSWT